MRFTFLYHTGTLKMLSLTPDKWLIHFNAIIRNWIDNTYPQWKLLCSSGENVQRALVETSESSCHLEMCVLLVQCVCWMRRARFDIYQKKGKAQVQRLRQQWGFKHPEDLLGWKGEQSGGETWAALACVSQDVVELLHPGALFAVLVSV